MKNIAELRKNTAIVVAEKLAKLEAAVVDTAAAMNAETMTQEEFDAAKDQIKKLLSSYNNSAEELAYYEYAEKAENPQDTIRMALTDLYLKGIKKASVKPNKKTGDFSGTVTDKDKVKISLPNMLKYLGVEYFHDSAWLSQAAGFACIFAEWTAESIGACKIKYPTDQIAKDFRLAPNAQLGSKNLTIKTLQTCVDSILFIPEKNKKGEDVNRFKMTKHHLAYLSHVMTGEGTNPNEVASKGTGKMAEYLGNIIHNELNNLDFKQVVAE